jgi:phage gp37-like protein
MSAETLQDQAIAYIRSQFTKQEVVNVTPYGGEFTEAEISAKSFICPTIFVAVLGFHGANDGHRQAGRETDRVYMAAFVLSKAVDREQRARDCLKLTTRLAKAMRDWIPDSTGIDTCISRLEDRPTCENMYSRQLDAQNMARWLCKWDQLVSPNLNYVPPVLTPLTGVDIVDHVRAHVDVTEDSTAPLDVTEDIQFVPIPTT